MDQTINDVFYPWSSNNFGYERNRQTGNYVDLLMGGISYLFDVGGEVVSKYPFFLLLLSAITSFYAIYKLGVKKVYAFIGGFLYVFDFPFVHDSLVNGYLKFLFSYAFFPLLIYFLIVFFRDKKNRFQDTFYVFISLTLVSTVLNFFFAGLLAALIIGLYYCLVNRYSIKNVFQKTLYFSIAVLFVMIVQGTAFIIPLYEMFFHRNEVSNSLSNGLIAFLTFKHPFSFVAFKLHGVVDNYYERLIPVFGRQALPYSVFYIFLFSMVYGNFLKIRRSNSVNALLILSVFTVFILKGINEPFGYFNKSLYKIPLMAVFRNISYVSILATFSYSYLFAHSLESISVLIKRSSYKFGFIIFSILVTFVAAKPVLSGQVFSNLSYFNLDKTEGELFRSLKEEPGDYNIVFVPFVSPFYYSNSDTSAIAGPGFNPLVSYPPKPTVITAISSDNNAAIVSSIYNSLLYKSKKEILGLLKITNVKYIVFDSRFESVFATFINLESNKWFKSFLINRNLSEGLSGKGLNFKEYKKSGYLSYYSDPDYKDNKFSTTAGLVLDVGDYGNTEQRSSLNYSSLDGVFMEDYIPQLKSYIKGIHFGNSGLADMVIKNVDLKYRFEPGNYMDKNRSKPSIEWVPINHGQYWWYDPVLNQREAAVLYVGEGKEAKYSVPVNTYSGDNVIYVKVLVSSSGSNINFFMDDKPLGEVPTLTQKGRYFRYIKLADITNEKAGTGRISFTSSDGVNAVAEISVIPSEVYHKSLDEVRSLIKEKTVLVTYPIDTSNGIGKFSEMNDFYYSRESQKLNSYQVEIQVPESARYQPYITGFPKKQIIEENLAPVSFKPVMRGTELFQTISVPRGLKSSELCISYTYIDPKKLKPALTIPEKDLTVDFIDRIKYQVFDTQKISSSRMYSEGDWLYSCMEFNTSQLSSYEDNNLLIRLYTDSTNVIWGLPISNEQSDSGYQVKYLLRGVPNEVLGNSITPSVKIDGKVIRIEESKLSNDEYIFSLPEIQLEEGTHTLEVTCDFCAPYTIAFLKGKISQIHTINADYKKLSPSKFSIENFKTGRSTADNSLLIFRESYSPYWQLHLASGQKPSIHFKVNGYQNGWIIVNPQGDATGVTVEFDKDLMYSYVNAASLIVLIISFIIFGIEVVKFFPGRKG